MIRLPKTGGVFTLTADAELTEEDLNNFLEAGGVLKNPGYIVTVHGSFSYHLIARVLTSSRGTN